MKTIAARLPEGTDLKVALANMARDVGVEAGIIMSCVGSLSPARLRMAGAAPGKEDVRLYEGHWEIVGATGTISRQDMHVHLAISDSEGQTLGGHLKDGCIVRTTCEVVIGVLDGVEFGRRLDPDTGFNELDIRQL